MASILVIEDDVGCRGVLRYVLEAEGHEVNEAVEGAEGLELCRADPPDLLITDLLMPGQEGLETIRMVREEFPDIRVLAISGAVMRGAGDMLVVAERLGAHGTIAKPFHPDDIVRIVREVLE